MNRSQLTSFIKSRALELGFHKAGIARAQTLEKSAFLGKWLKLGRHGSMHWMETHAEKRQDIHKLYPDARSVVSVAQNYYTPFMHSSDPSVGKISRYAWGKDYHRIIKKRLRQLLNDVRGKKPEVDGRLFVDTAPIQDKLWAEAAGIGWQGKNTNILTREFGSWIFLGELVLNAELDYDTPVADYCGTCTACVDACPTNALEPYVIDARKCISYLTIEFRDDPIPDDLAPKMKNWIFGCDICQDVCPWNKFRKVTDAEDYHPDPRNLNPELTDLQHIDEDSYKKRFGKSPVSRTRYKDFLRNISTVLKNQSGNENK